MSLPINRPTIEDMNQLDTAVLMEKYSLILGMMNYGTPEQKKQAKKEFEGMDTLIHQHVNSAAFHEANFRLGFSEEELRFIEPYRE
ncbi:hypothetical protein J2S74_002840 [Evansella vedderi]|uniref:Uncharacterized protein n=1 Tax=Evansella vedderi TaxID=38282 RepID=A0ABT9ZYA3_9BACI|nr:hypothetical protein [Evansella vedderi]MDQ0255458.1 hypothetical protein [Evansella vedderi]